MNIEPEITFRNVEHKENTRGYVQERIDKLEKICDYISSCRVAVEKPQKHQQSGGAYRVRVDLTVPPSRELVASKEPGQGNIHDSLLATIRSAFDAIERQLKELKAKQRNEIKRHPEQEMEAIVEKILHDQEFGFLKTIDGRQIFFHKNAVLNDDFDRLKEGDGVNYTESFGDKGPQASTVSIVDKRG